MLLKHNTIINTNKFGVNIFVVAKGNPKAEVSETCGWQAATTAYILATVVVVYIKYFPK